jgi:hypothetical protein
VLNIIPLFIFENNTKSSKKSRGGKRSEETSHAQSSYPPKCHINLLVFSTAAPGRRGGVLSIIETSPEVSPLSINVFGVLGIVCLSGLSVTQMKKSFV